MIPTRIAASFFLATILWPSLNARGQQSPAAQPPPGQQKPTDMPGMMNMPDMHHDTESTGDAARSANVAMSGEMRMNVHMYMTALRPQNPTDDKRASEIVESLRRSIKRYKDYRAALADGYEIFLPNIPQEQYHFTNYRYGFEAAFAFNPEHPTSVLYKKVNGGYVLVGAMYTARKHATEDELNERVPLSVARWHKHVNLCLPPRGANKREVNWSEFGPAGSIATQEACDEAGGRWIPQIFGWMVHVYPYETDPGKIWAH